MIDVDVYFDQYIEKEGFRPGKIELIGWEYRNQGYLTREQLYSLVQDVSVQTAQQVLNNTKERCETTTRDVVAFQSDVDQVSRLCELNGITVPTASYVLTALDPLSHAIVNGRVWSSLTYLGYIDESRPMLDAADYATAIHHIRSIAYEEDCSTAAVGYALAAHGSDVQRRESTAFVPPERIPLRPEPAPYTVSQ